MSAIGSSNSENVLYFNLGLTFTSFKSPVQAEN